MVRLSLLMYDIIVGMAIAFSGLFETLPWIYLVSMYVKNGGFVAGCSFDFAVDVVKTSQGFRANKSSA